MFKLRVFWRTRAVVQPVYHLALLPRSYCQNSDDLSNRTAATPPTFSMSVWMLMSLFRQMQEKASAGIILLKQKAALEPVKLRIRQAGRAMMT